MQTDTFITGFRNKFGMTTILDPATKSQTIAQKSTEKLVLVKSYVFFNESGDSFPFVNYLY